MGIDIELDGPDRHTHHEDPQQARDHARRIRAERRKRRTAAAHSTAALAARPTWRPASSPSPVTMRDRGGRDQTLMRGRRRPLTTEERLLPELDQKVSRNSASRSRSNPGPEGEERAQSARHTRRGLPLPRGGGRRSDHGSRTPFSDGRRGRPEHPEAWSVVTNPAALAASWHEVPPLERDKKDRKPRHTDGRVSFSALHGNRCER